MVPAEWVWVITLRGSDELIGAIGLTPGEDADTAELGYWLSPSHWGRGITTEAAGPVVSFGFETLGLPCLTSGYFMDNAASGRVLEKLGFVETGRLSRPCLAVGGEKPSMTMELRRRDLSASWMIELQRWREAHATVRADPQHEAAARHGSWW